MGPADSRRISRVPRYSGAGWLSGRHFAYGAVTLSGPAFLPVPLCLPRPRWRRSYNPARRIATAAVWANARSLAATCAIILIFFSSGYLDVSVPQVRPRTQYAGDGLAPAGFPHSDIRGSQGICPSPRLFAACHVLLRLREPKASPMRPRFAFLFPHDAGAVSSSPWTLLCTCFRPVCPAAHGLTKVSVTFFARLL